MIAAQATTPSTVFSLEEALPVAAGAELLAEGAVAAVLAVACGEEVAEAGEAVDGLVPAAERRADAAHLAHRERPDEGLRVRAEAHAVADAERDGVDVLQGGAELEAAEVGRRIDLHPFVLQERLHAPAGDLVLEADDDRGRLAACHLDGDGGAAHRADRRGRARPEPRR